MAWSSLVEFANWLQQTRLGSSLAESSYTFPLIEGVHLIGLSFAIGLLFIADLRLIGVILRRVPPTRVLAQLRPWILGGFAMVLVTGWLLFMAEAPSVIESPAFALKLVFIAIAGVNAAYFEFVIARRPGVLADAGILPSGVRSAAMASLVLWTLVIVCGRLIPYLPGSI